MLDLTQSEETVGNIPLSDHHHHHPAQLLHCLGKRHTQCCMHFCVCTRAHIYKVYVCFCLCICAYVLFISRSIHLSETPSTIWRRGVLNGLM